VRVDETEVRRIASLAHLSLSQEEVDAMVHHFARMGEHFVALREVEAPLGATDQEASHLREDQVRRWRDSELVLMGAPRREGHFFKVPRIGE
jgi:aspartyl-tRNA(Asn)/glutamyl-tRNA(Gln) amidotransferase subunit C